MQAQAHLSTVLSQRKTASSEALPFRVKDVLYH